MDIRISYKIIRNALSNLLKGGANFVILIFLTPFMILKLGNEGFGVWALVSVLASNISVIDLGIPAAIVKYVAEFNAKNDLKKINEYFNTSFFLNVLLSCLFFLIFLFFKNIIIQYFFKVGPALSEQLDFVLIGSIMIFAVNFSFGSFASVLEGLQRIDISNLINMASILLNAVLVVMFLLLGFSLKGLVIAGILTAGFTIILRYTAVKIIRPEIKIDPRIITPSQIKGILGFSIFVQASSIASFLHFNIDKLLISYFLGIGQIVYYDVAAKLAFFVRRVPEALLAPIMPAASELHSNSESSILKKLYFRSSKYSAIISFPMFIFIMVFAGRIMLLWLGPGYELSAFALRFLAAAFLINILTGPGFHILNGMGLPKYGMESSVIAAVINFLLSLVLIMRIGFVGVVYGTTVSMIVAALYFIIRYHQITKTRIREYIKGILSPPLTVSIIMSAVSYFLFLIFGASRLILGIIFIAYFALFILIMLRSGVLDENDRQLVFGFVRGGK